jgi:broad specificity phosphatase PhoE
MRLVLIRHSKSCANHVRHVAGTEDHDDPLMRASQQLRDPPLSAVGERMARNYGPRLRARLRAAGFDLNRAVIGSSQLRRAKQTAALLFDNRSDLTVVPHFTENGALPENTPKGMRYRKPDWGAFLRHLSTLPAQNGEFIIVGHGSFLKGVWHELTGQRWAGTFNNLDAFIVEPEGRVRVLRYQGDVSPTGPDKCALPTKIAADDRMKRHTRKHHHSRSHKQRGGAATPLPLGYFKDGAQLQYTSASPTGANYGVSNASWARAPIEQTGGRRRTQRKGQAGGFAPSLMGSFAANGMTYLPSLALYTGYKLFKNQPRRRGTRRHRN